MIRGIIYAPICYFGEYMKIIKIEEFSKTKNKIITDENVSLVLYKADLRRYGLVEGMILETGQTEAFLKELLPHRAKARCLKLLQARDYTETEIRRKLTDDGYPEEVIEETVKYLYGFHYLDDEKYVRMFYRTKCTAKSRKQIVMELQRKGISKEVILGVLENMDSEETDGGDLYCIQKLLYKRKYIDETAEYEEKEKVKAFLFRKGFDISDINSCMRNFSWKNM